MWEALGTVLYDIAISLAWRSGVLPSTQGGCFPLAQATLGRLCP